MHNGRFGSSDLSLAHSLVAYRLGLNRRKRGCAPLMYAAKNRWGPDRIPRSSRFLHCLARLDRPDQRPEDNQANVLTCLVGQPHVFLQGAALQRVGAGRKRIVLPACALANKKDGPYGDGDSIIDVTVAVVRYLARKAGRAEPSFAAAAAALRARDALSFAFGFGSNSTKKGHRRHGNATAVGRKRHHRHAPVKRSELNNATAGRLHRHHARRHPSSAGPRGDGAGDGKAPLDAGAVNAHAARIEAMMAALDAAAAPATPLA